MDIDIGIQRYREETVIDSRVWSVFYTVELIIFTLILIRALKVEGEPYLYEVKISFYIFQMMIVVSWLVNILAWTIPINNEITQQFRGCVFAATFERTNFCLFLIIMYKLLYSLKRVEFQINPKFTSPETVLKALKRHQKIERVFITISALIVIFILVISISFMVNTSGGSNSTDIIYFFLGFAFFLLNLFILA